MDGAWNLTPRQQRSEGYRRLTLRGVVFVYNPSDTLWHRQEPAREEAPAPAPAPEIDPNRWTFVSETLPVSEDYRLFRHRGRAINWTYSALDRELYESVLNTQQPQTPTPLEHRLEQAMAHLRQSQARGNPLQVFSDTRTVQTLRRMIANQNQTQTQTN